MLSVRIIASCAIVALLGCSKQKAPSPSVEVSMSKPYDAGRAEAEADITAGKLGWKLSGQPCAHDALFKEILMTEYSIDLQIVAGCSVTPDLRDNINGYNERMTKAIREKYSRDVVPLAEASAKQRFEDRRGK